MLAVSLLSLTSISQLALFLGIGLIIFGWVEKKQNLIIMGHASLIILGLFASWVLFGDFIQVPATPAANIPKEVKLLGFFKGSAVLMGLSVVSVLMCWQKVRFYKTAVAIVVLFAVMLFFMVFKISQIPATI